MTARETIDAKALRLIGHRRVNLRAVAAGWPGQGGHVEAYVVGDTDVRHVSWRPAEGWQCSCPAPRRRCSHVAAVAYVIAPTVLGLADENAARDPMEATPARATHGGQTMRPATPWRPRPHGGHVMRLDPMCPEHGVGLGSRAVLEDPDLGEQLAEELVLIAGDDLAPPSVWPESAARTRQRRQARANPRRARLERLRRWGEDGDLDAYDELVAQLLDPPTSAVALAAALLDSDTGLFSEPSMEGDECPTLPDPTNATAIASNGCGRGSMTCFGPRVVGARQSPLRRAGTGRRQASERT